MANQLQRGMDKWADLASLLNHISYTEGEISRNDERIWDGYLHRWSNRDWLDVLHAIAEVQAAWPDLIKPFQAKTLTTAAALILKYKDEHPRVLDTREHKKTAWAAAMCLREIYNAVEQQSQRTSLFEVE